MQNGGAVGGSLAGTLGRFTDISADQGDRKIAGFARQPLKLAFGAFEEALFFDQIARRISGDGQLGEDDQVGAQGSGAACERGHAGDVAREVANRAIDLA